MKKYLEVLKEQFLKKLGNELAEKTNNKINLDKLKEYTKLLEKNEMINITIEKTTTPSEFYNHLLLLDDIKDWKTGNKSGSGGCWEDGVVLYGSSVKFGRNIKHENYENGNLIESENRKYNAYFCVESVNIVLKEISDWNNDWNKTTYLLIIYMPEDKKENKKEDKDKYKEYLVTMGNSGMIVINNVEYLKKFNIYELCQLAPYPYFFISNNKDILIDTLKTIAKNKNINNPIVLDRTKEQEEKLTEYMKEKHYKNQK